MVATGEQSRTKAQAQLERREMAPEEERTQQDVSQNVSLKSDLARLLQGTVKSTKPKPPSTKEIKKEAFGRYMKIIYKVPHDIQVNFDEDSADITSELREFNVRKPCITPVVEDAPPPPMISPAHKAKEKKRMKKKAVDVDEESEEESVRPSTPVIHESPVEKKEFVLPKLQLLPPPAPKPLPALKSSALLPSPEVPSFLQEFVNKEWFKHLHPDNNNIPNSLSPDSFSLQLVDLLCSCDAPFKPEILTVLEMLHRRRLFLNVDQLYQKLLDTVPRMVTPNMCASEQAVLDRLLNLLMHLKSVNGDLVKTLLTLAAYKKLGLRERMLHMLKSLGVGEAEEWLWPELETWESEFSNKSNTWKSLYTFTDCRLNLWTAKYKDHIRDLFLMSTGKWKLPPSFTAVDVVNHFCAVQKENYIKSKQAEPSAISTVILPHDCISGAIHRLGETYCMKRTRKPSNLILPPLRNRPFLLDFPKYISFPLPHIKLSPFYTDLEENHLKFLDHRYYILEKSHVGYYR